MKTIPTGRSAVKAVLAGILLWGIGQTAEGAFLDGGWGARPLGMGGAFSAVADDSNAPLFNPAGLVQVQWNELSAMYAKLFTGLTLYAGDDTTHLNQSYLAFIAKPSARYGSWGISWANFTTTHLYREDTVTLSYARHLGDFIPVLDNLVAMGVNVKYLRRSMTLDALTVNDPVFASGDSAQAVTADVGLLYKPEEGRLAGCRVALVAQNLTQPNVGFGEVDRVPLMWRLGLAYQSPQMNWLVPALDLTRRNSITEAHAGLESWLFHDTLGLRTGINRDEATAGVSFYQALDKKFGFRMDYGFSVPFFVDGTSGSHRLSATVYF